MNEIIRKAASVMLDFLNAIGTPKFARTSILVVMIIFLLLAMGRLTLRYLELADSRRWYEAVKDMFREIAIWFFILGSPALGASLAGFVVAQAKSTLASDGPAVGAGQDAMNEGLNALKAAWSLRGAIQERLATDYGVGEELTTDNLENFTNAQERLMESTRSQRKEALANKTKALQDIQSKDPNTVTRGRVALKAAEDRLAQITQLEAQWKAAAKPAKERNTEVAEGVPDGVKMALSGIFGGLTLGMSGLFQLLNLVKALLVRVGAILVVAPALFLCGSACMKILSAMLAVFGRLLAYCVSMVVAGAMASAVAPFAILSFGTKFDKFGWNWVTFWVQAAVLGAAAPAVMGLLAKGIHVVAAWGGDLALAIQLAALSTSTTGDFFFALTLGALPMMGVGFLCGQIPVVLDKSLSSILGPISGQFHP